MVNERALKKAGIAIERQLSVLEINKIAAIIDYAHTPDGLENILRAARELTPENGNLICLFGCGGNRDCTKRPKMGKIAQQLADKIIVTSDNPRSEDPQQIITDILSGLAIINPKTVFVEQNRAFYCHRLKKSKLTT